MKHLLKTMLMVLFLFLNANAESTPGCDFKITCSGEMNFSIEINSTSHDCSEDDAVISFKRENTNSKLTLPAAWYYPIGHVGPQVSTCKSDDSEYPLFKVQNSQALVFFRKNSRPGFDVMSVALLDYKKGQILDQKELGEIMRHSTGIFPSAKGFKLPLVKENLKGTRCDCDAAFVEGWLEVSASKSKIKTKWL